jgi:hypothetical protein
MPDEDFEKFLDDGQNESPQLPIPCVITSILKEKSKLLSNLLDSSLKNYGNITNDTFRNSMELYINKLFEQALMTLNQFDYLAMECEPDDDDPPQKKDA